MSIRKTMLAAALAAFAFAALPAVASAYSVDPGGDGSFTVKNSGNTILRAGSTELVCTGLSGEGQFEKDEEGKSHGGSIKFHFSGCKGSGTNCTSAGQSAGNITTTTLPFHVIEVRHPDHETAAGPGVLITPGAKTENKPHFASFKCAFGLIDVRIGGNGIIGTLTDPGVEDPSESFSLSFEEDGEKHQTHTTAADTTETVDTETHYQLETSINGGETSPFAQIGEGSLTFNEGEGQLTGA